jgi:hypothetical protein
VAYRCGCIGGKRSRKIEERSFDFMITKEMLRTRKITPKIRRPYSAVRTAVLTSLETALVRSATQQLRNPPAHIPKIVRKRLDRKLAL